MPTSHVNRDVPAELSSSAGTFLLEVDRLTAGYGPIEAVHEVSIRVESGQIVAVLGPNGAGKTTLLSTILGLVRSTSGRVFFDGRDITGCKTEDIVRRGVGLVPEGRRLFKNLTVRDNLRLGAATRTRKVEVSAELARMLELFPILGERLDQLAGFLSGGEAQQLAIARAMMAGPRLLVLDEPSLGLAPKMVEAVFGLICGLRDQGFTVLLVEQNALQVLEFADRAYVLRNGSVAMEAKAGEFSDEKELLRVYLGMKRQGAA